MASSRSGEESESESEEQFSNTSDEPKGRMSEYEKQRFSRIAENKARLKALGITKAANGFLGSSKRRGKPNSGDEDYDYRPGEADGDEDDESDEEFLGKSSSFCHKRKNKTSASKRKVVLSKTNLNRSDPLGEDDDDDLNKAIALSLDQDAGTWKKKKPGLMSKMQMTEDELVIYFYQFDEAGKGFITLRDVAKMAMVHDFTWTEEELQDMICCFDIDKDGKLSLDEFRKIVTRCRMLKDS